MVGFGRNAPSSFGRPEQPPPPPPAAPPSLGPIHADLVLTISDDVLREVGTRIAQMVADATRQGFQAGLTAANTDPLTAP